MMWKRCVILGLSGLLLASCGSDETPLGPDPSGWTSLRFHEFATDEVLSAEAELESFAGADLWLDATGQVAVSGESPDSQRGDGAFTRGLLAGDRLETIVRLVAHLPARSHRVEPTPGSTGRAFFLRLTKPDGAVVTHLSNGADDTSPAALRELHSLLGDLVTEFREPRTEAAPFETAILGSDARARGERRVVLRSRDGMLAEARSYLDLSAIGLPRVDFATQMIVACYAGTAPAGTSLGIEGVERTSEGFLRVRLLEARPDGSCDGVSRPFVWGIVPRQSGDFLFSARTVASGQPCGD